MKKKISMISDIIVALENIMLVRGNDVTSISFNKDGSMVYLTITGHFLLNTLEEIGNVTEDKNPEFFAISDNEVQVTLTNYLIKN